MIALAEGAELAEHDAPPAPHDEEWILGSGQLAPIPPQRHGLTDAAILLTVALR